MNEKKNKNTDVPSQDELLELQRRVSEKSKLPDLLIIVLLLLFIFGFAIFGWIIPDKEFSETENRVLTSFPKITSSGGSFADRLIAGKFSSEMADYYADQFPLRDSFVALKAATALASLRRENDSVIAGKNGYIISRSGQVDEKCVEKNVSDLSDFAEYCKSSGLGFYVAAAPRSADILGRYISSPAPDEYTDKLRGILENGLTEGYTDLYGVLAPHVEAGEYVYYRTDHHWTTLGAYYAYEKLAAGMGIAPIPMEEITKETASEEFFGTTWSSAGMRWIKPDTITYFRYAGDGDYRIAFGGKTDSALDGFYDRTYLEKKDKYGSFLSGNSGRLTVYKTDGDGNRVPERPVLVVIKDSFANSLIPFLARDYDIEVIDLRYYKYSVAELAEESGACCVIALYNYDSFLTENAFGLLRMGVKQK